MAGFAIEGCDRVGKTTLIEKLRKHGYHIVTVPRPGENGWEVMKEHKQGKEDAEKIVDFARRGATKVDFILDRFSYSELVYSRVSKRPCDYGWYENILKKNKDVIKLVLIEEDYELVCRRWVKEGKPVEQITPILAEYNVMISRLGLKKDEDYLRFCPSSDKLSKLLDWISENGKGSFRSTTE